MSEVNKEGCWMCEHCKPLDPDTYYCDLGEEYSITIESGQAIFGNKLDICPLEI